MNITKHLHNLSSEQPAHFIPEILHEKHTFLLHGNFKTTSNPYWYKPLELFLKKKKNKRRKKKEQVEESHI